MVSYSDVLAHNDNLKHHSPNLVALFVGATSGIGLATLRVLATQLVRPTIYIVGRSQAKFAAELSQLKRQNSTADFVFIESEIALLENVNRVCVHLAKHELRLDLLYLSPGYLGFGGPHLTGEGLDTCFALSLYSRMLFVQGLLPLLLAAPQPRVLSVLAGGHERALYTVNGDLGLRNRQNYTAPRAVDQVTTLHTLAFVHLASRYPKIAFLHTYPGWVATNFLSSLLGTLGVGGRLLDKIVQPLYRLVAIDVEESGQWHAYYATSRRYPSRRMIESAQLDVENAAQSHSAYSGVYLVLADGETCTSKGLLKRLEVDSWPDRSWKYLEGIFEEVLNTEKTVS
uniref:CapD n=1 Tax=Capnodium sp. TTI-000886 TaxID=3078996 RepID=A0AA96MM76_9PEZI|nr:CapD [Capnodium sp. TTI-000886]